MPNYDNIRRYSEFSHEAAQNGGVDAYLDIIAEANQEIGIAKERSTEGWKGIILAGGVIAIWEGGKKFYCFLKDRHRRKKAEQLAALQRQSDEAKAKIINDLSQTKSSTPGSEKG